MWCGGKGTALERRRIVVLALPSIRWDLGNAKEKTGLGSKVVRRDFI